ncbi:MAG: zf-HC2 domain-containing protein [Thermodesulfovibrionales bacterium]
MRSEHDGIKELFSEYLKGTLSAGTGDTIAVHLAECAECREELECIREVLSLEVPDPGDLFWKTLPQRVRLAAPPQKPSVFSFRWLQLRPVAASLMLAVLIMALLGHYYFRQPAAYDPLFRDPLSTEPLDVSSLKEKDIPRVRLELPDAGVSWQTGNFMDYGYQGEFSSLSAAEAEAFMRVLNKENKSGG